MKYIVSTAVKTGSKLADLPASKIKLTVEGESSENIWVAKDFDTNKMYLLNHAFCFYPYPSWGLELELTSSTIDVTDIKGTHPDHVILTVHPETIEGIKEYLNEEGTLDIDRMQVDQIEKEFEDEVADLTGTAIKPLKEGDK